MDHGSCVHVMLATNLLQYTYKYGAVWYRWELLPDRDIQNANWLATTTKNTNSNHGNAIDSPEKSMSRSARDEKAESCDFFFMVSFTFFFQHIHSMIYCTVLDGYLHHRSARCHISSSASASARRIDRRINHKGKLQHRMMA